nr:hypothetical protein [Tanacetum cinerariifolium]
MSQDRFKIGKKRFIIDMEVFRETFRYALDFQIKSLMHFHYMKKLSPSLRNLATKETLNLSLNITQDEKEKFKKPTSPSKKRTLVTVEEEKPKPAKKVVPSKKHDAKRQSAGEAQLKRISKEAKEKQRFIKQVAQVRELISKGKSIDTSDSGDEPNVQDDEDVQDSDDEPQHADDERTDSDNQETTDDDDDDDNEETEDEFIHTLPNYVPTDDEMNDESNDITEEEYERINEELYGDVNVSLTDAKPVDKEKDNEEMNVAGQVNVNKEGVGNQVKDDAQETQKTEVTLSSSISSNYAAKFLNFDNIRSADTKVISILDINVHHEVPQKLCSIIKEHSVLAKIVERLKQQYAPQKSIKDIREIKMEHARKHLKQRALYHDLMESILKDEDAMDEGVADKLKKRKPDDADKDEGPSAGSHRGKSAQAEETVFEVGDTQGPQNLRKDMDNTDEPPVVNVDPKDWFKKMERPPTPDPKWNKGKSVKNKPTQNWLSDLTKAEKPSRTFADLMSTPIDFSAFVMNRLQISKLTQDILVGPTYNILKGNHQIVLVDYFFNNDLAYLLGGSTDRTYTTLLTKTKAAKYNLPRIEDMNRLFNLKGDAIVHLAAALRMFTRRIMIQKRVEDLQLGVESYQKKLNIFRPMRHKAGITDLKPYYAYSKHQGFIYVDKLGRNRLMCSHELYKFSNGTLISLRDTLKDMANNLKMGYTSVMPKRRFAG